VIAGPPPSGLAPKKVLEAGGQIYAVPSCGLKTPSSEAIRASLSGESSTQIRPPCNSTIEWAIASPSPLPPAPRSRAAALRLKRSKTRFRSAPAIRGPSSSTRIVYRELRASGSRLCRAVDFGVWDSWRGRRRSEPRATTRLAALRLIAAPTARPTPHCSPVSCS
jgi:hypothetical protein